MYAILKISALSSMVGNSLFTNTWSRVEWSHLAPPEIARKRFPNKYSFHVLFAISVIHSNYIIYSSIFPPQYFRFWSQVLRNVEPLRKFRIPNSPQRMVLPFAQIFPIIYPDHSYTRSYCDVNSSKQVYSSRQYFPCF